MSLSTSSTIRLKAGEQYTLVLKGRFTAGYQWTFSAEPEDIVSVDKKVKPQKEPGDKRAGSSANELFILTAIRKGEATVHFRQLRIWEAGSKPLEEQKITVIVE